MSMYRLAESKDLRISYLTRLLKISAVDCVTNYIWNRVWTESEIAHLKKHHKYTVGKNTFEIDDNAIKLLNNGVDIVTVQELLAHASPEMTMKYAKLYYLYKDNGKL